MKYSKLFKAHLEATKKSKIIDFFFKNQTRYLILLLALDDLDGEKNIIKNFNYYYKNIPSKISSQININHQIDLAIAEGYLIKKKSTIDKRSTIVTATPSTKDEFDKYFKLATTS